MFDSKFIDNLVKRLADSVPPSMKAFKKDFERNAHSVLMSTFSKMNLITREEFEVQKGVLNKLRSKVETLEKELATWQNKNGKKNKKADK